MHSLSCAKCLRNTQPVVIHINHDDFGGGVKLSSEQRGHTYRARANNCNSISGFYLAIQHSTFKSGRQNITEHHQRLFVRTRGNEVETVVRMRYSHIFSLCAINYMAQNPAAIFAV